MCLGGGGGRMSAPKREYQNRPVTVSGEQTGVDDPKDTAKATETLKIKRQKEEGPTEQCLCLDEPYQAAVYTQSLATTALSNLPSTNKNKKKHIVVSFSQT